MHHCRPGPYTILLLLLAAAVGRCREARTPATPVATPAPPVQAPVKPAPPRILVVVDSVSFRRNYHGANEMSDREADRYINRDPEPMGDINPTLQQRLEKAALMRRGGLRLQPFHPDEEKYDAPVRLRLKSKNGHRASVRAWFKETGGDYVIHIDNGRVADSLVLPFQMQQFRLLTADIVPGGFPELVLLRRWYISNGDNYDINIYEIADQ